MGDVPFLPLAAGNVVAEGFEEVALRHPQDEGEVEVRAQQGNEQDVAPEEVAGAVQEVVEGIQHAQQHTGELRWRQVPMCGQMRWRACIGWVLVLA